MATDQKALARELSNPDFAWLAELGIAVPPTQDELPYEDGVPMESERHASQLQLLKDSLALYWSERDDVYVGGNMFVYFNSEQSRRNDFRGPDLFVVTGVPKRERKSWVVWEEGKGPDLVIELLSDSTEDTDRTEKKYVYQNVLHVPEYYWFHPFTGELAGFELSGMAYTPKKPNPKGRLTSGVLNLALVKWTGTYQNITTDWLRFETPDGVLLPTPNEVALRETVRAEKEKQRAEREHRRADRERIRTEQERQRAEQEHERAEREREKAERERQRAERLAERLRAMGLDPDQL